MADVIYIVELLLVGVFYVCSLLGVMYFRYVLERFLIGPIGRTWVRTAVSIGSLLVPAIVSIWVGLLILATTSIEAAYYIGGLHLVLSFLGTFVVRELVITREPLP